MARSLRSLGLSAFRRLPRSARLGLVHLGSVSYTVGAVLVVRRDGDVLLVAQRHTGGWGLPGGLLRRGEPPADGVLREVREEIGVRLPPHLLGRPTVNVDPRARRVDVIYEHHGDLPDEPRPREPEVLDVRWFPEGALPERMTRPTRQILRAVGIG